MLAVPYNVTVILPYLPPSFYTVRTDHPVSNIQYRYISARFFLFFTPLQGRSTRPLLFEIPFLPPPPEFLASTVQPYVLVPRVRPLRTKTAFVPSLCLSEGGNLTTQITSRYHKFISPSLSGELPVSCLVTPSSLLSSVRRLSLNCWVRIRCLILAH